MSIKEVLAQHKMHKEMNSYMQALSFEVTEDYSMLYYADMTKAQDSQKYAKILLDLINESKKSNNTKAYAELKAVVDTYGKWKHISAYGQQANAPSKICLSLPKAIQSKLDAMYNAQKRVRSATSELTR